MFQTTNQCIIVTNQNWFNLIYFMRWTYPDQFETLRNHLLSIYNIL